MEKEIFFFLCSMFFHQNYLSNVLALKGKIYFYIFPFFSHKIYKCYILFFPFTFFFLLLKNSSIRMHSILFYKKYTVDCMTLS